MSNGDSSPLLPSGLGHPHLQPPGISAVLPRRGQDRFLSAAAGKGKDQEGPVLLSVAGGRGRGVGADISHPPILPHGRQAVGTSLQHLKLGGVGWLSTPPLTG